MADGRFLSKTIAHDLELNTASLKADYLFTRMIPHLDVEGRMPGVPMQVKAMAVPMRHEFTPEVVDQCLTELEKAGLVQWFSVKGRVVLQFPGFQRHQKGLRADRETPSVLPSPEDDGAERVTAVLDSTPATSPQERAKTPPKLSEVKRRHTSKPETDPVVDLWEVYLEELGGEGRQPSLTQKRKKKLQALLDEQLAGEDDPAAVFRRVLQTVKASDHHMSQRSYQMPESLFVSPERRERWVLQTTEGNNTNGKSGPHYVSRDIVT